MTRGRAGCLTRKPCERRCALTRFVESGPWTAQRPFVIPGLSAMRFLRSASVLRSTMNKRKQSESPELNEKPAKRLQVDSDTSANDHLPVLLSYPSTDPQQSTRAVPFQQPTGLITFSYTPQRVLEFGNAALRYYVDPPPGADLRYGYERWIKRPEERTRLDGLLKAIERVMQKADASMGPGSGKKWLRDISVVTWRGVMTK